jgi:hypothetical protein
MSTIESASMLLRKARSLARMPVFEQTCILPAWILLGVSRGAVLLVPFRRVAAILGEARGPQGLAPQASARQMQRARRIGRVIRVAARYTPWDSNCFAQAVTARLLLGLYRIPCAVFFGLAHDDGPARALQAHAWVCSGDVAVSGGANVGRYTVVACFVAPGGSP